MVISLIIYDRYLFNFKLLYFTNMIDYWININILNFQILKIASSKNKLGWWLAFLGFKKIIFRKPRKVIH